MKILNQFKANYDVLHDVDNHSKHTSTTLKAQKTNCLNIYKYKGNGNVRIYCSISNFENAIGIGDVPNDKKTLTIYQIINNPTNKDEYSEARALIKDLFKHIVQRDEEVTIGAGFCRILQEENYNYLFDELINQKVQEEKEEEQKKEKLKEKTVSSK